MGIIAGALYTGRFMSQSDMAVKVRRLRKKIVVAIELKDDTRHPVSLSKSLVHRIAYNFCVLPGALRRLRLLLGGSEFPELGGSESAELTHGAELRSPRH
jgi:hypothetical protein